MAADWHVGDDGDGGVWGAQEGRSTLTFGSLFAGIGGFDLGLERAGWECRWQVEIDERKRGVLARHWPAAPRFGDITTVEAADLFPVDLIAGGFPCQDISHAGRRAGLEGEHSGLWAEFARLVRCLRPRFVLVENSTSLLVRGMERVLGDLAASGYDAEWDCIPAAAVGSPQLRARTWVLAYPRGFRTAADDTVFAGRPIPDVRAGWPAEPDMGRVADGLPGGLDRVGWLGDAVVPQVVEHIGRLTLEAA
jgi:DNA (cytosine-5)-methyltransferase 1